MIDQSETFYYFFYMIVCVVLGLAYIRSRSTEGTVITTKEFQIFQTGFVSGYAALIFCELIASASFYHTFISIHLNLEQITRLYIVTTCSTVLAHIIMDIVDLGTRKDKCVLSAALYSISMFSIFFGGHYEMLLIGRIVYGVASALQHTSFESYGIHQHSSHGFPDDWLSHTFTLLTHCMALVAALSGIVGQISASLGSMGCVAVCCLIFTGISIFLSLAWEKDVNTPRFMLSGFLFNVNHALSTVQSNKHLLFLLIVSSLCETSITIFTFYWAPWFTSMTTEKSEATAVPYEILFSTFVCCCMLGNYIYTMFLASQQFGGIDSILQYVLIGSSVAYFLGAILQTPFFAYFVSLAVQTCIGVYWPCIGFFRGKIIAPEIRSIAVIITK